MRNLREFFGDIMSARTKSTGLHLSVFFPSSKFLPSSKFDATKRDDGELVIMRKAFKLNQVRTSLERKPVKHLTTVVFLVGSASLPAVEAAAQTQPAQISEQSVDEFGVERKTGRIGFSSPEQIKVGGDGAPSLAVTYIHVDGGGLVPALLPRLHFDEVYDGTTNIYYEYFNVQFPGVAETFRRVRGASALTPEYPTGSTLVVISGGYEFTDKHGFKLIFTVTAKAKYPDGRLVSYNGYNWLISPWNPNAGVPTSITNNFGYMLKISQTNGNAREEIQATNMAVDLCDSGSLLPCSGLSQTRTATVDYSATDRFLTDASGSQTRYRFTTFVASPYRNVCSVSNDGTLSCPSVQLVSQNYPAGITLPGASAENLTITYSATPMVGTTGIVHDDIRVAAVTKDGITATYQNWFSQVSSGSYPTANQPSFLTLKSFIAGQQISNSYAIRPASQWGRGRTAILHVDDALMRRTIFGFNAQMEVSGFTAPELNDVSNIYDARQNIERSVVRAKPNSGLADLATLYTYSATCSAATLTMCNKPLTVTDPRLGVADYTYNTSGQVLTATLPAPLAGSPRPQTTNTYTMRVAYIRAANGGIVAAGPPISLLTKSSTCQSQATCAGTSDEMATHYDYGPPTGLNNLNLRGVGAQAANGLGQMETRWTCYQYNYFGEMIAETQPNAALTSCP